MKNIYTKGDDIILLRNTKGDTFISELLSGKFTKKCIASNGFNFTGGYEGIYRDYFERYICSCGCHVMDNRIKINTYKG